MIITITGLPGSGKTTVAKELARHLHIKCYALGNLFRKIAKQKRTSVLDLTKRGELMQYMDNLTINIAKNHKNVIIDSRMGAYLIKNADARIYLHASLKKRISRMAKRDKKSYQTTLKETLSRERQELRHYKERYGTTYQNKRLYNIILNTENLIIEETTKKLINKINKLK